MSKEMQGIMSSYCVNVNDICNMFVKCMSITQDIFQKSPIIGVFHDDNIFVNTMSNNDDIISYV